MEFQYGLAINPEFILDKYSQEEIFYIVFGEQIYDTKRICSPFRKDNNPNCYFEMYNDKLWFVDFGDKKHIRDCFEIIMDKYKLTLKQSCIFIYNYFQNNSYIVNRKEIKYNFEKNVKNKEKNDFSIIIKARDYKIKDKIYWEQFCITKEQLLEDKVYPVIWFKTMNFKPKDFLIRPTDISYAITDFHNFKMKIYTPLEKNKKKKWFTNCKSDDIGNVRNLPETGKNLIITKSYKDCRILRNQGVDSIWLQNETCIPSLEILYDLYLRFENIYTLFDNDQQGRTMSESLKTISQNEFQINIENMFIPDIIGKDSADFIKRDKKQFIQFLIKNLKKTKS